MCLPIREIDMDRELVRVITRCQAIRASDCPLLERPGIRCTGIKSVERVIDK